MDGSHDAEQVLGYGLPNLEHKVFGSSWLQWQYCLDHLNAIAQLGALNEHILGALDGLCLELFYLFLHRLVLFHVFGNDSLQVLGIVEQSFQRTHGIFQHIDGLFAVLAGHRLNTADTRSHTAL